MTFSEPPNHCDQTIGFEGPEKRFEIDFTPTADSPSNGLRSITKEQWQEMLDLAKCTILNVTKNDYCDAYVLSESSLFVYPYEIIIKTCGTTTLLRCVTKMLEYASSCFLKAELVRYSRKNFLFPSEQHFPHMNWEDEVAFLNDIFEIGQSQVLCKHDSEPWYLYLADFTEGKRRIDQPKETKTLEIMMHHLEVDAAQQFYKKEGIEDRDKHPAMINLLNRTMITDEFNFTPCGYSMNGLDEEIYSTIHVTPEPHCSYASYETTQKMRSYTRTIEEVFRIFRPGTAQLVLFTEKFFHGDLEASLDDEYQMDPSQFDVEGYRVKHKTFRPLDANCSVLMIHYESNKFRARSHSKKAKTAPVALVSA